MGVRVCVCVCLCVCVCVCGCVSLPVRGRLSGGLKNLLLLVPRKKYNEKSSKGSTRSQNLAPVLKEYF